MSELKITIDDAATRAMLQRAPAKVHQAMRGGINDATALLLREMKIYPQQRTGSWYVRTNTLKRSWHRTITGTGMAIQGRVGSDDNIADYAIRVQDFNWQAPVHRRTWANHTVQAVVARNEKHVREMFASRLRSL